MKIKIHCFEGEWNQKHPELSVKPLLQVLEQLNLAAGENLSYCYKFCQTTKRLEQNLSALDGRKMVKGKGINCFYFAFHGNGQGISNFEDEDFLLSFDRIATLLGPKAANSIVLFGSCGTHATTEQFKEFQRQTKAALVVGYAASVDWLSSSLFEMTFFSELCQYKYLANFKKRIHKLTGTSQELFAKLKVQLI